MKGKLGGQFKAERNCIKRTILFMVMFIGCMLTGGCDAGDTGSDEGVAIYLSETELQPSTVQSLQDLKIGSQPVISMKDIMSYNRKLHSITLTREAYQKLAELYVPMSGRVFVVCVNRRPVYWGAFWSTLSSISFGGVVIPVPLISPSETISLELGYPTQGFFTGEDPRDNPAIMQVLQKAGKLE